MGTTDKQKQKWLVTNDIIFSNPKPKGDVNDLPMASSGLTLNYKKNWSLSLCLSLNKKKRIVQKKKKLYGTTIPSKPSCITNLY